MDSLKKVFVISFSSRKNGNSFHIASYVTQALKNAVLHEHVEMIDFSSIISNVCGECNYECFDNMCIYLNDDIYNLYRKLLTADLIFSIVPIYCGLPCSNYFIFNERIQGALRGDEFSKLDSVKKKYIIIGNTGIQISKEIFSQNDDELMESDILSLRSNDVCERSIKGNLMEYDYYKKLLDDFLNVNRLP